LLRDATPLPLPFTLPLPRAARRQLFSPLFRPPGAMLPTFFIFSMPIADYAIAADFQLFADAHFFFIPKILPRR
jgi:hypothetical protein